jgi:hypothetical protein
VTSSTRSVVAVVVVLAVAGVAYWAWQRFFSRDAELRAIHAACVADFDEGKARAKSVLPTPAPPAKDGSRDAVSEFSAGLGTLIDNVAGGVAQATCGAVRESCRLDWDGTLCAQARARLR